jgi:hypothetical protein
MMMLVTIEISLPFVSRNRAAAQRFMTETQILQFCVFA